MHRVLALCLAVLALAAFLTAPALAEDKTETHEGKVVSVKGNQLTMTDQTGTEVTHTLAADAKVTQDGKPATLADLKPGTTVRVTTPQDNRETALRVEAQTQQAGAGQQPAQPKGNRPFLGIRAEPVPGGVAVRDVEPGSPAAQGGLRTGDVITKVDDQQVQNFDALVNALFQHKPGDKINLQVKRQDKDQTVAVTLGQRPAPRVGQLPQQGRPTAFLGVQAEALTPEVKNRLGVTANEGAVVMQVMPGTPAANAGLQRGDVITSVENKPIANPEQLRDAVQQAGIGKDVNLKVERGKETRDFKAHLEQAPADLFTPPIPPQQP